MDIDIYCRSSPRLWQANLLGLLTAKAKFQLFKAVLLVVSPLIIEKEKIDTITYIDSNQE